MISSISAEAAISKIWVARIMFVSEVHKTKILLHKRAAIYAISQQQSLNSFIEEAVRDKLAAVNA